MKILLITVLLFVHSSLLAQTYLDMKKEAFHAFKSGNKKQAFKLVNNFIGKHPKNYKAKNLSAVFYYWSGDNNKAKNILEDIVSNTNFPEANQLLRKVNDKIKPKNKKSSYKAIAHKNEQSQASDLKFLVDKIDKNPQDIKNRILLSKYYFKIDEFQKSYDLAHEVLEISPNNKNMKTIVSILKSKYKLSYSGAIDEESAVDKIKAKAMLIKLYNQKKYTACYNLYDALRNAHVIFTQKEYIDILHAAIMIGEYQEANRIIQKGLVPLNEETLTVQLLLTKKLIRHIASR